MKSGLRVIILRHFLSQTRMVILILEEHFKLFTYSEKYDFFYQNSIFTKKKSIDFGRMTNGSKLENSVISTLLKMTEQLEITCLCRSKVNDLQS